MVLEAFFLSDILDTAKTISWAMVLPGDVSFEAHFKIIFSSILLLGRFMALFVSCLNSMLCCIESLR
jgi:hypothetical protein